MKVTILCGGLGTRLSEETQWKPKPMVPIGGKPILWHIMNIFSRQGFDDFTLAIGYKGEVIRDYFLNYHSLQNDFRIDLGSGQIQYLTRNQEAWKLDVIDTGQKTLTGGRLHRLEKHLRSTGTFMLTYGDGVADVNLRRLLDFHQAHGKIATVTSVRPPARFGNIVFDGIQVRDFQEKPHTGEGWVNGGFFVFEPAIFDYLSGDQTVLEGGPLERLARDGQLMGFKHEGFWQCMDTARDQQYLNDLCMKGDPPWFQSR